jgi:hypothetical protein
MIAFTMPKEITAVFGQCIADFLLIFSHLRDNLGAALRRKIKIHIFMFPAV